MKKIILIKIAVLILGAIICTMSSCTKKVWQCQTFTDGCPGVRMETLDYNNTGIDSFYYNDQIVHTKTICK